MSTTLLEPDVTSSTSNHGPRKDRDPPAVDPKILAIIKNASAPVAVPKNVRPPDAVPGSLSPIRGIRKMFDMLRRGVSGALEYRAEYGDIYKIWIAGIPMVGIWDADAVNQILRNEDRAWSAPMGWDKLMFEGLDPKRGNVGGLLALDFEEHRVARKLVAPGFTTKAVDGYLVTAERHFAETNAAWVSRGSVGFKAEGRVLLSRVAGELFTGITDRAQMAILDRALTDFWYVQHAIMKNDFSPTFRRGKRGIHVLIDMLTKLMPERRRSGGPDLLSRLCAVEDREGLGDEDVIRLFVNIMGAAFDTTAAGLTSMAYMLAKHPDWQDRLRDEARAIGDRPLDAAAAREMKLHDLVWKETLRLMPVAAFLPRRSLREVEVGGFRLPAGTFVVVASGANGRHPKWWKNPSRFDPERFSPERAEDKQHPGIYNPFGGGPHVCIGMQLATMEVKAYWHDMLRRCRFRLTKDYDAEHTAAPLGTASGAVNLTLEPLS